MIRLVADAASQRGVDNLARFFGGLGLRIDQSAQQDIQSTITRGFETNFRQEASGQGRWARLAEATRADRELNGFPPASPILTRTWDYRNSLTNPNDSDHFSQVYQNSTRFAMEEGSESPLFPWHEGGTPKMPARSVTDLDDRSENELGDVITRLITGLMKREGL